MSTRSDRNFSTRRDQSFHHLKSNFANRIPLANANDANPAIPTNLIAQKPPGGYEEGSLIYNQSNNSAYIRTTDGGAPTWTLLNGGGGGGNQTLFETLAIGNFTGANALSANPTYIEMSADDLVNGTQGNLNLSNTTNPFYTETFETGASGGGTATREYNGGYMESNVSSGTDITGMWVFGGNDGGDVGLLGGIPTANGRGNIYMIGGSPNMGGSLGGGEIFIRGGDDGNISSGSGRVSINGGASSTFSYGGGTVSITGGHNNTTSTLGGGGGPVNILGGNRTTVNAGDSSSGGDVTVQGGTNYGTGTSARGGFVFIRGGDANSSSTVGTSTIGTGNPAGNPATFDRTLTINNDLAGEFAFESSGSDEPATHLYFAQPINPVLTPGPNITASFTTGGGGFFNVTDTCGIVVVTAGAGGVSPVAPLFTLTFDKAFPGNRRPVITLSEDPDVTPVGPYLQSVTNTSFIVNTSSGMGPGDVVRIHYQVMSCFFNNT